MNNKKTVTTWFGFPRSTILTVSVTLLLAVGGIIKYYFEDQQEATKSINDVAIANVELKGTVEVMKVRITSLNTLFIDWQNKQKELEKLMRDEIKRLETEIVELKNKKSD